MSSIVTTAVQSKTVNTPPIFKESGGDEIGQLCRAWVNFDGTGTVAIREGFNVSSITDNNVGDYNINFTNNMSAATYSVSLTSSLTADFPYDVTGQRSSSGFKIRHSSAVDPDIVNVQVFSN